MASWQPHGLIQKRVLEAPYRNAKLSIDAGGNSKDPKEHFTVKLFEDLFHKQLFIGDNFSVNSQQPPSTKKGSEKACDIVIMYVDTDYEHQILCFAECKRAKNVATSKIKALETQAQGYCKEFLDAHPDNDLAYACTLVGVYIRCWLLRRGDSKLQGFWAGSEKDHFEHYRDVGLDEHRRDIELAFDMMKSVPPLGLRLGQDHSTIGASSDSQPVYSQPISSYSSQAGHPQTYALSATSTEYYYPASYNDSTPVALSRAANIPSTSQYAVTDPGRYEAPQIPSQPMETEQKDPFSNFPQLLDENYVSVSIREYGDSISGNVYRFVHEAGTIEKRGSEWHEETVLRDGQWIPCMVCIGKTSGIRYWTRTLDPMSDSVGVDLKHKGKGNRRG